MNITDQLVARIIAQGADDKARARALGVSARTITEYKAGRMPRILKNLLERGILVVRSDESTKGGEA